MSKHQKLYCIDFDDLIKFLKNNPNLYDANKIEKNGLGLEYDWLEEKREKDKTNSNIKSCKKYSSNEESKIRFLLNQGYTYKKIAKELNRSEKSISSHICRMRKE